MLLNKAMRGAIGWLYIWKNTILIATIVLSILIYRPFCKYICPLGAFYSIFNKVSLFRYRIDGDKCVHCGKCAKVCQMNVDPVKTPNSPECIQLAAAAARPARRMRSPAASKNRVKNSCSDFWSGRNFFAYSAPLRGSDVIAYLLSFSVFRISFTLTGLWIS